MKRRFFCKLTTVAMISAVAGCISDNNQADESRAATETPQPSKTESGTNQPTVTKTKGTIKKTTSGLVKSGDGDYPHRIAVDNFLQQTQTITITVTRNDTLLYRETHEVPPQTTQRVVAGFTKKRVPKRKTPVSITAELPDGQRKEMIFSIDPCRGDVLITINRNGELQLTYSVC